MPRNNLRDFAFREANGTFHNPEWAELDRALTAAFQQNVSEVFKAHGIAPEEAPQSNPTENRASFEIEVTSQTLPPPKLWVRPIDETSDTNTTQLHSVPDVASAAQARKGNPHSQAYPLTAGRTKTFPMYKNFTFDRLGKPRLQHAIGCSESNKPPIAPKPVMPKSVGSSKPEIKTQEPQKLPKLSYFMQKRIAFFEAQAVPNGEPLNTGAVFGMTRNKG